MHELEAGTSQIRKLTEVERPSALESARRALGGRSDLLESNKFRVYDSHMNRMPDDDMQTWSCISNQGIEKLLVDSEHSKVAESGGYDWLADIGNRSAPLNESIDPETLDSFPDGSEDVIMVNRDGLDVSMVNEGGPAEATGARRVPSSDAAMQSEAQRSSEVAQTETEGDGDSSDEWEVLEEDEDLDSWEEVNFGEVPNQNERNAWEASERAVQ